MFRTTIQLMIASCFICVLFISMGSKSFADPPLTCEAACVKIVNGQMRCVDLDTTCLSSEVYMLLGGGGGGGGQDGMDGMDGADGAACWDTNPEGTNIACDEGEDINLPEGCGVEDCIGPQGPSDQVIGGGTNKLKNNGIKFVGMYTYFEQPGGAQSENTVLQTLPIAGAVTDLHVRLGAIVNSGEGTRLYDFIFRNATIGDTVLKCTVNETSLDCMDDDNCVDNAIHEKVSVKTCPSNVQGCGGDTQPNGDMTAQWTALFHPGMTCADLGFPPPGP